MAHCTINSRKEVYFWSIGYSKSHNLTFETNHLLVITAVLLFMVLDRIGSGFILHMGAHARARERGGRDYPAQSGATNEKVSRGCCRCFPTPVCCFIKDLSFSPLFACFALLFWIPLTKHQHSPLRPSHGNIPTQEGIMTPPVPCTVIQLHGHSAGCKGCAQSFPQMALSSQR